MQSPITYISNIILRLGQLLHAPRDDLLPLFSKTVLHIYFNSAVTYTVNYYAAAAIGALTGHRFGP